MTQRCASQPVTRSLARSLLILRGLLAAPSGDTDDPYARVVLSPAGGSQRRTGGANLLTFGLAEGEDAPDRLRERYRAILAHRAAPADRPTDLVRLGADHVFSVTAPALPSAPVPNKVALVTGAAGAIGAGICRGLLERGFHVAATDLDREALNALVSEFLPGAPDRIMGVPMDVSSPQSVERAFATVACRWGGIDVVVVNAGIAATGPITELDPDLFRRLEKVNVEGTLITLAEAGRYLCRQKTGGDIVLISTKNVFAPGAQFGAYSATKAASHQLARIASLEFAPFDIRVNMVAPDAVFADGQRKSGLWAAVGPSRMKARNLDEKGLQEYYRNRNLLKVSVTARHVANAVLFFATRQTPTTGATIPVDGGLPEATPR